MESKNNSFRNRISLNDYSRLLELKQKYERNEISETELSIEDKNALIKLYEDEDIKLKQEILFKKTSIKKMRENLAKKNQSN